MRDKNKQNTRTNVQNNIQKLAIQYKETKSDRDYSKLVKSVDAPLFLYLKRYVKGYDNIRSVMADTYEVIWRKIDDFNTDYSFLTWLFCISKNISINSVRAIKNNHVSILDKDVLSICIGDFSELAPTDAMVREMFLSIVIEAVRNLPEPFSTIMYLRDIESVKFSDISEMLGENSNTLRGRIAKARQYVSEYITEKYPNILEYARDLNKNE
ncbi:MAG: RNA polymerase sigma factor [Bacteroidales bacterium]